MKSDLQKATESLLRIHKYGGQDAEFLRKLREDVENLIQFLTFSFLLKEVYQKIDLPRGWQLSVAQYCPVHQKSYYPQDWKQALVLERFEMTSTNTNRSGKVLASTIKLWSCTESDSHNSREELFVFADEVASGWVDEVADRLAAFRLENVDWSELRFFIGKRKS